MHKLILTIILLSFVSCGQAQEINLDLFVGEWKRENKDQFEVWEKTDNAGLTGYSYRIKEGKKVIWEKLSIQYEDGEIVYRAQVADQNEGAVIPFKLNKELEGVFSFENPDHDFPKAIRYIPVSEGSLKVEVKGKEGEGFSFVQHKQ